MYIRTSEIGWHCFIYQLITCSMPRHYPIQCWHDTNQIHSNKFQWNLVAHLTIFRQRNQFENIVCKMVATLVYPQSANWLDQKLAVVIDFMSLPAWGSCTGLTLGLCPANGRHRYRVTSSLIGWLQDSPVITQSISSKYFQLTLYISAKIAICQVSLS